MVRQADEARSRLFPSVTYHRLEVMAASGDSDNGSGKIGSVTSQEIYDQ
jgi:hypothetical protein